MTFRKIEYPSDVLFKKKTLIKKRNQRRKRRVRLWWVGNWFVSFYRRRKALSSNKL